MERAERLFSLHLFEEGLLAEIENITTVKRRRGSVYVDDIISELKLGKTYTVHQVLGHMLEYDTLVICDIVFLALNPSMTYLLPIPWISCLL